MTIIKGVLKVIWYTIAFIALFLISSVELDDIFDKSQVLHKRLRAARG